MALEAVAVETKAEPLEQPIKVMTEHQTQEVVQVTGAVLAVVVLAVLEAEGLVLELVVVV